jgi:hypothetical protein
VTVYGHDFTENYEYHVVGSALKSATATQALVEWLQTNGYNVSDNMTPVMDVYNSGETVFLALKLRSDREVSDIQPIALTYGGIHPSIPIVLTAVAAQPLMGLQVFIVADGPYVPANYNWEPVDPEDLLFDASPRTNYFEWVARRADEANGQLWVVESIGDYYFWEEDVFRVVSRFYTRMSAHQMTVDPVFQPHPDTFYRVSNQLDLTSQPSVVECGAPILDRQPTACAFNYCGTGGECTVDDAGQAGCICGDGLVAQAYTGPDGLRHVTCVPYESPYGVTPEAGGAGTPFDPCAGSTCGDGMCVLRAGFPTCDCLDGGVAVVDSGSGRAVCAAAPRRMTIYGPGAGLESANWDALRLAEEGAAGASDDPGSGCAGALPVGSVLLSLLGLRSFARRRRRDLAGHHVGAHRSRRE